MLTLPEPWQRGPSMETGAGFTVTPEWLAQNLDAADIRIVDCRFTLGLPDAGRSAYDLSHIPGAWFLDLEKDLSAPVGSGTGRHPLPSAAGFEITLAPLGLTRDTLVVAYDGGDLAFAARLWWMLRYFGHSRTVVMEQGFPVWEQLGLPTDALLPEPLPGKLKLVPNPEMIMEMDELAENLGKVHLIDSRAPERFRGEVEPLDPIAGHIPTAVNSPWQNAISQAAMVRGRDQNRLWSSLTSDREVVVYCGSGVTACPNILSLELAGFRPRLYPGGWSQWCSQPGLPKVTGS